MNYNKNELINTTLDKYYETFSHMLDTSDYVPEKFNDKIGKYIFKNLKKTFKLIDGEDRKYQRKFKKENQPKKIRFIMFKKLIEKVKGLLKIRSKKVKSETNSDNISQI